MPHRNDRIEERIYKSAWHALIAAVGVYELRNHKTTVSKILACGLIAFHMDAMISDALDAKPLSRKVLEYVAGELKEYDRNNHKTKHLVHIRLPRLS